MELNNRSKVAIMLLFLVCINAIGWFLLIKIGSIYAKLFSLGTLAFVLGMRHAFDADHISAIDNTTRKLVQEGKRPVGVGFFFSLGHSTVVFLMALAVVITSSLVAHNISGIEALGSVVGTSISAIFLYAIGLLNLIILIDIYRVYAEMETGRYNEEKLEKLLVKRGIMSRIFGKRFKLITSSWQMYPVGFLFGLGFDTASEIALLAITATATANMFAIYVMILPLMFMLGMTLLDTLDGIMMLGAYNWAFKNTLSKIYYNMTITAISVVVAFFIGSIEILQVISTELGYRGGIWAAIDNLDFGLIGVAIIAIFAITWIISAVVYKYKIKPYLAVDN